MIPFFPHAKNYIRFVSDCVLRNPNTKYRSYSRHIFWLVYSITAIPLHLVCNWFLFLLDDIFWPKIKQVSISKPIFIIGNFRTGTTLIHRLLAKDTLSFTAGTGGEIFLTPSFFSRQIFKGIRIIDSVFGSPIKKIVHSIEYRIFKDIHTHKVSRREPEEDESFFLHNFSSAFLAFLSPAFFSYKKYFFYDEAVAESVKKRDMNYYELCLKRHMYYHRKSKYYLSKSPTFTSRCLSILKKFPDARFLYLLRDPQDVLPSLMSMFTDVWSIMQKKDTIFPFPAFIIEFSKHWAIRVPELLDTLPEEQVKFIKYSDMISEPVKTIQGIYNWLEIPVSEEFMRILVQFEKNMTSHKKASHSLSQTFFDKNQIQNEFAPFYERLAKNVD